MMKMNLWMSCLSFCFISTARLCALSLDTPERPAVEMAGIPQKVAEFAKGKLNLDHYFIDRIWLTKRQRDNQMVWAISYACDRAKTDEKERGWKFFSVDMKGAIAEETNLGPSLPWVPASGRENK